MMNRNPLSAYHTEAQRRVRQGRRGSVADRAASAFTLVELLTVIAITIILLGLLFGPIIQGFNFTRRARAIAQAQDSARFGLERLSRELGSATFVYDNISSTITLPLQAPGTTRQRDGSTVFDGVVTADPATWPTVAFGRIDFVTAGTRSFGQVTDPTTGNPTNGAEIRPFTRGTRVIRYFLGLRNPVNTDGTQRYYENIYEFSRSDNEFNPVVLYRAEFDPRDPNLFDLRTANYSSAGINSGGFNDPNFFYNQTAATTMDPVTGRTGNGRSYAANWQSIAKPVLASQNADLLIWNRRGNDRQISAADPFKPAVSFTPASVAGDTATPGFLENASAEAPGAVPSLYTTKYAQWAMPYRVTFLRGSTNYNGTARTPNEPYGTLTLEIGPETDPGSPNYGQIVVRNINDPLLATGSLKQNFDPAGSSAPDRLYVTQVSSTGKLFVKTPHLAFQIDPERGRIETGLPPLAGANGVPSLYDGAGVRAMNGGAVVDNGELIPTRFVGLTRAGNVGATTAAGVSVPINQGIIEADMFALPFGSPGASPTIITGYIPADTAPTAFNVASLLPSPLDVFGTRDNGATGNPRGILVVAGSERVLGPDPSSFGTAPVVPYTRVPLQVGGLPNDKVTPSGTPPEYVSIPSRPTSYGFEAGTFDNVPAVQGGLDGRQAARLVFSAGPDYQHNIEADQEAAVNETIPGLPARRSTDAGLISSLLFLQRQTDGTPGTFNDSYFQATYLWQNNYARVMTLGDPNYGRPLDDQAAIIQNLTVDPNRARPEADVVKVDYSTRTLINVSLGARVYDVSSGAAQSITIADKIQVNNVGR